MNPLAQPQPQQSTSGKITIEQLGQRLKQRDAGKIMRSGKKIEDVSDVEVAHAYLKAHPERMDQVDTSTYDPFSTKRSTGFSDAAHNLDPKGSNLPNILKLLTSSERTFGGQIAAGIGAGDAAKKQMESNTQLADNLKMAIQKRNELREAGKDTSKADTMITDMIHGMSQGMSPEDLYEHYNDTAEQVFGAGLGVATDIIGAGSLPGIAGSPARTTTKAVTKGMLRGSLEGAAFGGAQGVAQGMQDDKSAGNVAVEGVGGALIGGAIGGAVGGIAGKMSRRAEASLDEITDYVMPAVPSRAEPAVTSASRFKSPSLLTPAKYKPTDYDIRVAESVEHLIDPLNRNAEQNIGSVLQQVTDINAGVRALITENKVPFNTNQLKKQLMKGKDDLSIVFGADPTTERIYDQVVDAFLKDVSKKDTLGLFDARQTFDRIPKIRTLLQSSSVNENVRKEIVSAVRGAANDYVADLLPKNNPYKSAMENEKFMLRAVENIYEKAKDQVGDNTLQIWAKKYPIWNIIIGGAVGAAGLGFLSGGVGAGASLIRSTD